MKLPILAALAAAIPFLAADYAVAQEPGGLSEKARKEVREMIRKELKAERARAAKTAVPTPFGWPLQTLDWQGTNPVTLKWGSSPAAEAIAAAERAVEADKRLTKKQRVAALKALETARKALGKKAKTGSSKQVPVPRLFFPLQPGNLQIVPRGSGNDLFFRGPGEHGTGEKSDGTDIFATPHARIDPTTDRSKAGVPLPRARLDPIHLQIGDHGLEYSHRHPHSKPAPKADAKAPAAKRSKKPQSNERSKIF